MKKLLTITVVIALAIGALSACSLNTNVKKDTIFVENGGKIIQATIENFDEKQYSEKELKQYVQNEVNTYKSKASIGTVKVQTMNIKKGKAKLFMEFSSYKAYAAFNEVTFFSGNLIAAQAAGYEFDVPFYKAKDAKKVIDASKQEAVSETATTGTTQTKTKDKTTKKADTESVGEDSTEDMTESATEKTAKKNGNTTTPETKSTETTKTKATPVSKEKVLSKDTNHVMILEEDTDVVVPDEILYVSSHVKVTGKNTATVTNEGANSTDVTPAYIIYK